MKYLKRFFGHKDKVDPKPMGPIEEICHKYKIRNYIIRENGLVDVYDDLNIVNQDIQQLPLKFGIVTGNIDFRGLGLTDLTGFPIYVAGNDIILSNNKLKTFEGIPKDFDDAIDAQDNCLESFKGLPMKLNHLNVSNYKQPSGELGNRILNFDFIPYEVGEFHMYYTPLYGLINAYDNRIYDEEGGYLIMNMLKSNNYLKKIRDSIEEWSVVRGNEISISRFMESLEDFGLSMPTTCPSGYKYVK